MGWGSGATVGGGGGVGALGWPGESWWLLGGPCWAAVAHVGGGSKGGVNFVLTNKRHIQRLVLSG